MEVEFIEKTNRIHLEIDTFVETVITIVFRASESSFTLKLKANYIGNITTQSVLYGVVGVTGIGSGGCVDSCPAENELSAIPELNF